MELEKRFGDLLANGLGDEGVGLLPVFGGLLARELIQVGEGARWSASQGGQAVLLESGRGQFPLTDEPMMDSELSDFLEHVSLTGPCGDPLKNKVNKALLIAPLLGKPGRVQSMFSNDCLKAWEIQGLQTLAKEAHITVAKQLERVETDGCPLDTLLVKRIGQIPKNPFGQRIVTLHLICDGTEQRR